MAHCRNTIRLGWEIKCCSDPLYVQMHRHFQRAVSFCRDTEQRRDGGPATGVLLLHGLPTDSQNENPDTLGFGSGSSKTGSVFKPTVMSVLLSAFAVHRPRLQVSTLSAGSFCAFPISTDRTKTLSANCLSASTQQNNH